MFRKTLLLSLLICSLLAMPAFAITGGITGVFTIGSTNYFINGQTYSMDVAPYIKDSRTFVPIRYVATALGISSDNIVYDNGKVTLIRGNRVIQLAIGSNVMTINATDINMDVKAEIVNGRTMLPVRWISVAFGADVNWDKAAQTVTIKDTGLDNRENSVNLNLAQSQQSESLSPVTYPSSVTQKDYNWQYNGVTYKWHVEIPTSLLEWDRQVNSLINRFYDSDGYIQYKILSAVPDGLSQIILSLTTNGNYISWVKEETNNDFVVYLAQSLSEKARVDGYDYMHTAEFVQSFVGGAIPYIITDKPELPAQTLVDNGDCKDKSILLAAILKNMGYRVALLDYPPPPGQSVGHMAVGIVFSEDQIPLNKGLSYYPYNGIKYYFAETTEPNWKIGEISDKNLESKGYVYPVN